MFFRSCRHGGYPIASANSSIIGLYESTLIKLQEIIFHCLLRFSFSRLYFLAWCVPDLAGAISGTWLNLDFIFISLPRKIFGKCFQWKL